MTSGVTTCLWCGNEARAGLNFCPACARPLGSAPPQSAAPSDADDVSRLAFTNSWDSVVPRLQEALFGEFVISRELGRGGMAAVFLAHQLKLDRKVAIKVMAPSLLSTPELSDRFRVEATTVARLEHPNIISIFEIGEANGLQYFVMQYVPGRSLERVIRQWGPLPLDIIRAILFEVGSALAYAHRRHVIHRDVKPGNILLSLDGRVMVSDFGIAKVAESSTRTQTGVVIGTPSYMSPEQCLGLPLTGNADQYSLGVITFEMLTGVPPFAGTPYNVMRGHTDGTVPTVLGLRPDCPPEVAAAVSRMLSKQPGDRFPTMSEALAALGASRMSVDEEVQNAIGRCAVPLPNEEGTVIVHTPVSPAPRAASGQTAAPAPLEAPPTREPRFSTLRATLGAARARLGRAIGASSARLAAAASQVAASARGVVVRAPVVYRALASRTSAVSRRTLLLAISGVALIAILAVGIALARRTGGVVAENGKARPSDSAAGTLRPPPAPADSGIATVDSAGSIDSLAAADTAGSLGVPSDSAAPSSIAISIRGRRTSSAVFVGDSARLDATVRDLRGITIPAQQVRWRSSRPDIATIDSVTGQLVAQTPGAVTVTATLGNLTRTRRLTMAPRPTAPVVATNQDALVTATDSPTDHAAEVAAVESAVTRFVAGVLNGRDIGRINELYRIGSPADSAGKAVLLDAYRERGNLTIRPQQDPPPPVVAGARATAEARISLQWPRPLRSAGRIDMMLSVDFAKRGAEWEPAGFRLRRQ